MHDIQDLWSRYIKTSVMYRHLNVDPNRANYNMETDRVTVAYENSQRSYFCHLKCATHYLPTGMFYLLILFPLSLFFILEQTCKGSVWQHCRVCRWAGLQERGHRHGDGSKRGRHQRMVDVLPLWTARPGPCKQTAAFTTNRSHHGLFKPHHRKTQINWCYNWWQRTKYLPDPQCATTLQQPSLWTHGHDLQGPVHSVISFKKSSLIST